MCSSDLFPSHDKTRFINKDIPTAGDGWTNDLKKAYMINEKIHKDRLNPHYKLNLNTNAKLRITPLGGLNETGRIVTGKRSNHCRCWYEFSRW